VSCQNRIKKTKKIIVWGRIEEMMMYGIHFEKKKKKKKGNIFQEL